MRKSLIVPAVTNVALVAFCIRDYLQGLPLWEVLIVLAISAIFLNLVIYFARASATRRKARQGSPKP